MLLRIVTSVSALRADIDHYRRGEIISAGPVSPVDLLKKLVMRNKLISGVIGASVLVIICGALIAIYFLNAKLKEANDQYLLAEERALLANRNERKPSWRQMRPGLGKHGPKMRSGNTTRRTGGQGGAGAKPTSAGRNQPERENREEIERVAAARGRVPTENRGRPDDAECPRP
jgi:hypothetical protein